MGQKFSALKKIRKARKQAQCLSTLTESTNSPLSREDDYAVPSSNGVENPQLSSIDISSEALPPIPELEAEPAPITLPNLCTELILDIAEYLPPSSHMSLSYSCRTMYNKMGLSFAEVLGDRDPKGGPSDSTLSIETRNVRYLERLELWNMLVRDGKIPLRNASYSGDETKTVDDGSVVTTPLYAPLSTEHRYLGTAGLLWVCPHRHLDYNGARMKMERSGRYRCGSSHISWSGPIIIMWSIMRIPMNSVPTSKEVEDALRPLEAPICPHLRLNDASVARIYDSRCQKFRSNKDWRQPVSDCRCSTCLSGKLLTVVCSYCDTVISFGVQPDHSGYRGWANFYLLITRTNRFGSNCFHRDWIAQVARRTDLEEYKRAWEATNAEIARRDGSTFYDLQV